MKDNISMFQILYVEDDPIASRIAKMIFRQFDNIKLIHVENALEALSIYPAQKFDLLLLDLGLPDIPGEQLAHMIHTNYKNVPPIIGLSAQVSENHKGNQYFMKIFVKPLSVERVKEIIHLIEK